jgi:hypothetical protein
VLWAFLNCIAWYGHLGVGAVIGLYRLDFVIPNFEFALRF